MDKRHREWARDIFARYNQEFDSTLVFEDEKIFIMDWKDKNGSGNLSTRYIVDKEKGDLVIKGDSGDCVASWYSPITVENLVHYINSTYYFIEKMRCSTNKYTYDHHDVEEDLEEEKQDCLKLIRDGNLDGITEEELEEDFDRMQEILDDYQIDENTVYPEELTDLFCKYDTGWWEGAFSELGKRIDKRIYLWVFGYQEGVERLRGKEYVRKE